MYTSPEQQLPEIALYSNCRRPKSFHAILQKTSLTVTFDLGCKVFVRSLSFFDMLILEANPYSFDPILEADSFHCYSVYSFDRYLLSIKTLFRLLFTRLIAVVDQNPFPSLPARVLLLLLFDASYLCRSIISRSISLGLINLLFSYHCCCRCCINCGGGLFLPSSSTGFAEVPNKVRRALHTSGLFNSTKIGTQ